MATPISNFGPSSQSPLNAKQPSAPLHAPEVAASPSDPAMLRHLYATMLRCRMIEQRAAELARAGKLRSAPPVRAGSEATSIGSMIELQPGDAISCEPSIAAHVIAGRPLGLLFADWTGLLSEYLAFSPEAAHSTIYQLPRTATVAGQLNIAAGFAFACSMEQRTRVVLVHMKDGFGALGFWHEAATVAAGERLPLIIVAEGSAAVKPGSTGGELRDRAAAYGIPGISVDANDVVAMWRVTQESIHRARGGTGPTLIDAQPLSAPLSVKPNGKANGRISADANDPLARMQHYLEKRTLWDEAWKHDLVRKFADEIKEAHAISAKDAGRR
jgi:pyruvate dehydrogenase E1 component alpha subunit